MLQQSSRLAAAWKERLHGAAVRARAARCAAPDFVAHDLLAIVKRRVDAAARAARPCGCATRARGGPCPVICICASCTNRNLLDVHVSCDSQTHSHHKTTRIDRGPSRRARARTRPRADPLTIERRGHVMTSRRAASIASRFSSRFSSLLSSTHHLSRHLRRVFAGCRAGRRVSPLPAAPPRQREPPPRRQLPSRHRRLRPRLPSPPRARCCRRRASSTATCSSRCRPRSSIPTRRPSSTRRPMAIRRRSCSCISNRNRSRLR